MIAYNADSPTLYGVLYHYPASSGKGGTMRKVYDWDSGVFLGKIPEVNKTYNVVGNANEHGLIIGESTFGGVPVLAWNQTGAVMDYGSLIYITLQRAKTVQEAIHTMVDLMDKHGYASGGESLSLADRSGQVWMMEMIGRGSDYGRKGAVWVAVKIPDGMVASHANQARITTFPRDDPENCLYADDVVDVAVHYGLYPATADPADFSFSDVYHPVDFIGARQGEARVWSVFSKIADSSGTFAAKHLQYALGMDTLHRMPLYIEPYQKLSAMDVMHLMASHYEETEMDSSVDVGSGLFESPYRPRPLVWEYESKEYHNERSIATPKTGWSFVGQIRPSMPAELAALLWFAVDDSSTAPRVPVYASSTKIAEPYAGKGSQDGVVTPLMKFDLKKAFWVQNMLSNFCYYRYKDVYPIVRRRIDGIQRNFEEKVAALDVQALQVHNKTGVKEAVEMVTRFGVEVGMILHEEWMQLYGELFVQFRDFYTITRKKEEPGCGCQAKEPGLSDVMKKRIVDETGSHYQVVDKEDAVPVLHGENGNYRVRMKEERIHSGQDISPG